LSNSGNLGLLTKADCVKLQALLNPNQPVVYVMCAAVKVVVSFAFTTDQAQLESWAAIRWTQSWATWSLLIG